MTGCAQCTQAMSQTLVTAITRIGGNSACRGWTKPCSPGATGSAGAGGPKIPGETPLCSDDVTRPPDPIYERCSPSRNAWHGSVQGVRAIGIGTSEDSTGANPPVHRPV